MRWAVVGAAASVAAVAATARPVRRLGWIALNRAFDRVTGMDTSRLVSLNELGISEQPSFGRYEPSGLPVLLAVFRRLVIAPDDVFVDFGSGKGRVIFWAARYPFKRVIGVELSEALNQIARANLARNRSRLKCQDIQFVTADATTYTVPDDATVAYFCNPFFDQVFLTVIDNICASLARRPRGFTIVYATPTLREALVRRISGLGFRETGIGFGVYMYTNRGGVAA